MEPGATKRSHHASSKYTRYCSVYTSACVGSKKLEQETGEEVDVEGRKERNVYVFARYRSLHLLLLLPFLFWKKKGRKKREGERERMRKKMALEKSIQQMFHHWSSTWINFWVEFFSIEFVKKIWLQPMLLATLNGEKSFSLFSAIPLLHSFIIRGSSLARV